MKAKTEESQQRILEAAKRGRETSKKLLLLRIEEYEKNPKLCRYCKTPIDYKFKNKKDFCNRSCAASFNNLGISRNLKIKDDIDSVHIVKEIKICIECNTPILSKNGKKFCGNKCFTLNKFKKYDQLFLEGKIYHEATLRRHIRKIYDKCCECGILEWNNKPIILEIHHIDGDSKNNKLENLQLLCPNCHSQTDNHKSKNKGNGRHCRRERYKNGNSY